MANIEKYGIDTIKLIVPEICDTAKEVSIAMQDGKINFMESILLSDNLVKLIMFYSKRKQLILELGDISTEEAQEIAELIETEAHNMKDKVKKALNLLVDYYSIYSSNKISISSLYSKTQEFINLLKR
jgi:hypothetical protein